MGQTTNLYHPPLDLEKWQDCSSFTISCFFNDDLLFNNTVFFSVFLQVQDGLELTQEEYHFINNIVTAHQKYMIALAETKKFVCIIGKK
jgi:hypothetical protein